LLQNDVIFVGNVPNRFRQPAVKLPELSARSMRYQSLIAALDSSQVGAAPFAEIREGFARKMVEQPLARNSRPWFPPPTAGSLFAATPCPWPSTPIAKRF
jgi:hypothetical protein